MKFFELTNQFFTKLRQLLLNNRKAVAFTGLALTAVGVVTGAYIFYYETTQAAQKTSFYALIAETSSENADYEKKLQQYVDDQETTLFRNYVLLAQLKRAVSNQDKDLLKTVLSNSDLKFKNPLLQDFTAIAKAKAYLLLEEYDQAIAAAESLSSRELEDLQLLTTAQTNLAQGNNDLAKTQLKTFLDERGNSELSSLARSYYYLKPE